MNAPTRLEAPTANPLDPAKFRNPDVTADGTERAKVPLTRLDTLWFNTGTLCNIACRNCYIESSPTNDRLVYLTLADTLPFLDEIDGLRLGTREIGLTGGEPFMNPDCLAIVEASLERGHDVLVLTNAMQPLMRPKIKAGLKDIDRRFPGKLTLRISLDHYTEELHDRERGEGSWDQALKGLGWLIEAGFRITIAGRSCWGEDEAAARAGFARLFDRIGLAVDAQNPSELILFPEMDERADVPEITVACWGILGIKPADIMCATSRMVVKRKGEDHASVLPCTLLPYDDEFGMGETLAASLKADGGMFDHGAVKLNHPHCAKFCVLGGGSCSAAD